MFFRAWAQGEARELGVSGWIRNCPESALEAHLEGEADDVDRMIERMRRGSSNAQVDKLSAEEARFEGLGRFELRG